MTHRKLANDETSAQFVMAAQQGKLKQDKVVKQPTMTKEKMMKTLDDHMNATIQQMMNMQKSGMDMQSGDPMQAMLNMMVEQAKLADDLYLKHAVENEEFEDNLMHYMSSDPEVQRSMQSYMMKMQMMQQGMQMGMRR